MACVGGGSNAIGIFSGFVDDRSRLVGVEPAGGAAVTRAQPGVVHWHGATPTQSTTQFNTTRGDITWLEEVTDAQFNAKAVKAK